MPTTPYVPDRAKGRAVIATPWGLRREFLADRTFASLEAAQAELDAWVSDYNTARPHQALAGPGCDHRHAHARPASGFFDPASDLYGRWR